MIVIGNGESRRTVQINLLNETKIGCNAIFRDCQVEHLICVDQRMIQEALENNVNEHSLIYTRQDWFNGFKNHKRIRLVPELPYVGNDRADNPWHWGSGPYAVLLASKLTKTNRVKMLGFDLYGIEGKTNNIYKNTKHYNSCEKKSVDPRYWIYQISKVMEYFPHIDFTIYQKDDWEIPKIWKKSNVSLDKISNIK